MSSTETLISRQDVIAATERIEPLPASVTRLLALVNDPRVGHRQVVDVIRYDAALTADLLARANTTMYAVRHTITDVGEAMSRLGLNAVVGMALTRAMKGRMNGEVEAYALGAEELWNHSLAATVAAEVIARRSSKAIPGQAATAALMHDIGKVVIADCLPPALFDAVQTAAATDEVALSEVEKEILGIDHGEVSAAVARLWGLPVATQIALTNHHHPDEIADPISHAVAAANEIAHVVEGVTDYAAGSEDDSNRLPAVVLTDRSALKSLAACGIDADRVDALLGDVVQRFREVRSSYSR